MLLQDLDCSMSLNQIQTHSRAHLLFHVLEAYMELSGLLYFRLS